MQLIKPQPPEVSRKKIRKCIRYAVAAAAPQADFRLVSLLFGRSVGRSPATEEIKFGCVRESFSMTIIAFNTSSNEIFENGSIYSLSTKFKAECSPSVLSGNSRVFRVVVARRVSN